MRRRLAAHLRHNVVGYLALFVALGGTGAYAANTVLSGDIKDGEVKTPDIANSAVTGAKIADGVIGESKLREGAIGRTHLQNGSVIASKLNNNGVHSVHVRDRDVRAIDVALNAITGNEILESSLGIVGNADMLDGLDSAAFLRNVAAGGDLSGTYPNLTLRSPEDGTTLGPSPTSCATSGTTDCWGPISDPAFEGAGYFKDRQGMVHLRGLAVPARSSAQLTTVFILPSGHRPRANLVFTTAYADSVGASKVTRLDVNSSGHVVVPSETALDAGWLSLSGISFRVGG